MTYQKEGKRNQWKKKELYRKMRNGSRTERLCKRKRKVCVALSKGGGGVKTLPR